MKSLGVYYYKCYYVEISQCVYMKHGLKDVVFYVQNI